MRRLPAVLALVATAAGCGSDPGSSGDATATIDCRLPCETLTDWVSYADHVAYVEVIDERELAFEQLEGEPEGNGYVPREVSADVGDVLWSRDGAPALPGEVSWGTGGWSVDDGDREPVEFGVPVDVGERYLAVLVLTPEEDGPPAWAPIAPHAVLAVGDDDVPEGSGPETPGRAALAGESPDEIAELLAGTAPDPVALRYYDVDPVSRYNAVVLESWPELHGFVKATGDMGAPGYVRTADLPLTEGPSPGPIPVYDETGEHQIDTFTPGVGVLHR
ncbi:hypothetical protein [Jiangella anatolica]|uniref:Uncharacterized protein n=1 Tax=Jiangella anatolica TaxID=2670374 RepID=A0A2W2B512_9ACTN|nr:hypothetical protein [Jiangella anatolica]PZF82511.1 hypothetical protein C1I92_16435 [Jiangella anatolica]